MLKYNITKSIILFLFVLLLNLNNVFAQFYSDWSQVSKLRKGETAEKIFIESETDLALISKNPKICINSYSIKLRNFAGAAQTNSVLNMWTDIGELYLVKPEYKFFEDSFFQNLQFIDHLILETDLNDSNILYAASKIPNLQKITLVLTEEPQDWDFIFYFQKIANLHVYGNFLPESLHELGEKLLYFHSLKELGLSVDYATDLPRNFNLLANLKTIKLYDNQSRINRKNMLQVQPEIFTIFGKLGNDQPATIDMMYFAEDYGLTYRENKYVEQIWEGNRGPYEAPSNNEFGTSLVKRHKSKLAKPSFMQSEFPKNPIEGLNIPSEVFEINTEQQNVLHTHSGLNLFIPALTVKDANGLPFKGVAFVSIRTITDPLDVAFRGLDLCLSPKVPSPYYALDRFVEIELSDGNFNLQLDPHINYKLDFHFQDSLSSFFYLDNEFKSFVDNELYKQAVIDPQLENPIIPQRYDEWSRNPNTVHLYKIDNRTFDQRFYSPETFFLFDEESKQEKFIKKDQYLTAKTYYWEKENASQQMVRIKSGKTLFKVKKVNPKAKSKGDIFFQILDPNILFSEFKAFGAYLFKLEDTLSSKYFGANFTRSQVYSDIRIEEDKINNAWNVILKTEEGFKVLKISTLLYKPNGKPLSLKKSKKIFQKYKKILRQREQSFNEFVKQRQSDYIAFYQKRQQDWEKKQTFKSAFVRKTGVYSMLRTTEDTTQNEQFFITFLDQNGLPIDIKRLFWVSKNFKTVHELGLGDVSLNQKETSLIFCVDYKGNMHYIAGEAFRSKNYKDGSLYNIYMQSVAQMPRNIQEFKSLLKYDKLH